MSKLGPQNIGVDQKIFTGDHFCYFPHKKMGFQKIYFFRTPYCPSITWISWDEYTDTVLPDKVSAQTFLQLGWWCTVQLKVP